MTPKELAALWDAYGLKEKSINHRFGLLASLLYNPHRRKNSRAIEPLEWFGDKAPRRVQTLDEARAAVMTWAAIVKKA